MLPMDNPDRVIMPLYEAFQTHRNRNDRYCEAESGRGQFHSVDAADDVPANPVPSGV